MSNHNVDMPYPVSTISNHNVVDSMSAYPVSTMSNNLNVVDNMTYQSQPPPPPSQQSPVSSILEPDVVSDCIVYSYEDFFLFF